MIRPRPSSTAARRVFLTLAALAVMLKVLVPPGFMVQPAGEKLPFPLVICTGQGALVVGESGHHDPADHGDHRDAPCVFAGHGLGAAPPDLSDAAPAFFAVYDAAPPAVRPGLAPGRGLAAPPPPATGPPALTI